MADMYRITSADNVTKTVYPSKKDEVPRIKRAVSTSGNLSGPATDCFQKTSFKKKVKQNHDNDNLAFSVQRLKFYPEDQEKMDKMSVEERIQYRRQLKEEGRYFVINEAGEAVEDDWGKEEE